MARSLHPNRVSGVEQEDLSSASSSMEEERVADEQTEVQPLPDMDPEFSAPPPPLPEYNLRKQKYSIWIFTTVFRSRGSREIESFIFL